MNRGFELVGLVVFAVVVGVLVRAFRNRGLEIQRLCAQLAKKQTSAYHIGMGQAKGDYCEWIGTFAMLQEYESVVMLSTSSTSGSFDLLGINRDCIDFIEFKKSGAKLTRAETNLRRLVNEKKVRYVVKDVTIPEGITVSERSLKSKSTPVHV